MCLESRQPAGIARSGARWRHRLGIQSHPERCRLRQLCAPSSARAASASRTCVKGLRGGDGPPGLLAARPRPVSAQARVQDWPKSRGPLALARERLYKHHKESGGNCSV